MVSCWFQLLSTWPVFCILHTSVSSYEEGSKIPDIGVIPEVIRDQWDTYTFMTNDVQYVDDYRNGLRVIRHDTESRCFVTALADWFSWDEDDDEDGGMGQEVTIADTGLKLDLGILDGEAWNMCSDRELIWGVPVNEEAVGRSKTRSRDYCGLVCVRKCTKDGKVCTKVCYNKCKGRTRTRYGR